MGYFIRQYVGWWLLGKWYNHQQSHNFEAQKNPRRFAVAKWTIDLWWINSSQIRGIQVSSWKWFHYIYIYIYHIYIYISYIYIYCVYIFIVYIYITIVQCGCKMVWTNKRNWRGVLLESVPWLSSAPPSNRASKRVTSWALAGRKDGSNGIGLAEKNKTLMISTAILNPNYQLVFNDQ